MMRAYLLTKKQYLLAALQYPANFLLDVLGVGLNGFAEVLMIVLLTGAFEVIGGWDFWQIGFMMGMWRLSRCLHHALFLGFEEHRYLIRDGEFDTLLIRPAHPLVQILAMGTPLSAVGELLPAAALFAVTAGHVKLPWNAGNILFFVLVIISGALIEWAVYLFFGAFDFWFPEYGKEWIPNTFLFATSRYPIHIYGKVFVGVLTFLFPYGFIAYYPTFHFFQVAPVDIPWYFTYLSPLVAFLTLAVALGAWRFGLRHYQSTGT